MAFSPLNGTFVEDVVTEEDVLPSKTYALNLDNGSMGGMIDGEAAIRQAILKAIQTERYHYTIYDGDYGCELEDQIGSDVTQELLNDEIPRMITEALVYDERFDDVHGFVIDQTGDRVYVAFYVETNTGTIPMGVTL